ncbi:MAG: dihydrofolate reductase [Planctomycetota bacterium]
MQVALIVAMSENGVIGRDGDLPWHISEDLKRFKKLTMGHHIIMGRKTWDSIGRLLPGRTTVIVTRQEDFEVEGAKIASSIEQALEMSSGDENPFITGGAQIYAAALSHVQVMHITRVHAEVEGDTFFTGIDWDQWQLIDSRRHEAGEDSKSGHAWSFETWKRV